MCTSLLPTKEKTIINLFIICLTTKLFASNLTNLNIFHQQGLIKGIALSDMPETRGINSYIRSMKASAALGIKVKQILDSVPTLGSHEIN